MQRLKSVYGAMEDSELSKRASEADTLTNIARQVLGDEMRRRSMEPPPPAVPAQPKASREPIPPEPVMIRRYRDLPEASIAKSVLESAGIESFLADENLVRLDWFYSNLVGGIKLFVRQEDAEEALKVLGQAVPEKFELDDHEEYFQPRCPNCKSFEVSFDGLNKPASYAAMWIAFPVPITNKGWKCHSCGHTWQEPKAATPADGQGSGTSQ